MYRYNNNRLDTFERVNKTKARKLYNQGEDIALVACNVRFPGNQWIQPVVINNKTGVDFDKAINEFEYYNCQDNTLGKYAAYYHPLKPHTMKVEVSDNG